jgi:hypothetical protein
MLGLGVTKRVGSFEHPRECVERGGVQRDHSVARFVLAAPHEQQLPDQIHIASPEMLDLDRPHRRVRRHDRGARIRPSSRMCRRSGIFHPYQRRTPGTSVAIDFWSLKEQAVVKGIEVPNSIPPSHDL